MVFFSDLERYLPQELQSAAFKVSRSGLKQEEPLQRLGRFESSYQSICDLLGFVASRGMFSARMRPTRFSSAPPHPDRWDMFLFAGGPVWAMEWCPTPDTAQATQYIALACHQGMDDQHFVNKVYTGAGLVQLWDVGSLTFSTRYWWK